MPGKSGASASRRWSISRSSPRSRLSSGCWSEIWCARAHQISDQQPDDKRERGDDLEIDQRLDADAPDFPGILNMRYAGNHGAEDDRRNHHLDQLDEAVAERLD